MYKPQKVVFYSIKGSTIKHFFMIDLVLGTGIYYVVKIAASSVVLATLGSYLGTEGIKKSIRLARRFIK